MQNQRLVPVLIAVLALGAWTLTGCSESLTRTAAETQTVPEAPAVDLLGGPAASADQSAAVPPGLVTVAFGPESLELWPYTGDSFSGMPVDPVNLLFAGDADPLEIRAALLALDGDRTAFGYPDAYPFNAPWSDAIGGVQANYAEGEGWSGSVIQLQLGTYDPIRFHLRLFQTDRAFGNGGVWTVGAAHFEIRIPDTADHQVLSWEKAREIVVADMIRSGLLDADFPVVPLGPISQTPSFRSIPDVIYNPLPIELKLFIGGPTETVDQPVPLSNDGMAYLLNVVGGVPVEAGTATQELTFTYGLNLPKPFCQTMPPSFVNLSGPVTFTQEVTVDEQGKFFTRSEYYGMLNVVPLDLSVMPPAPGIPYQAEVSGSQHGSIRGDKFSVESREKRIAPQPGGTEMLFSHFKIYSQGVKRYKAIVHCLDGAM